MQRRNFLSLIGAAAVAPALPAIGAPTSVAATATGYNRYMYGLAVFQARTRASITAADLVTRLGVSAPQASAMINEMSARGVLSSVTGAARIAATAPPRKPYVRKMLRQIAEMTHDPADPPKSNTLKSAPASARPVHTQCTSCDN